MRPDAVTLLFKEAFDIFPPLEGKPMDDDLLAIREALLPILMVIPFNAVGGVHSLTALLMDEAKRQVLQGDRAVRPPVRKRDVGSELGRLGQARGIPSPRGVSDGEEACASAGAEPAVGLPTLG